MVGILASATFYEEAFDLSAIMGTQDAAHSAKVSIMIPNHVHIPDKLVVIEGSVEIGASLTETYPTAGYRIVLCHRSSSPEKCPGQHRQDNHTNADEPGD